MDGSLRAAYRKQLEMYPPLTQEEVEALYASEGIQDKPIIEVIKELEDEIHALKSERDKSIKEIQADTNERHRKRYREITVNITALEEKRNELKRIERELAELMGGMDGSSGVLSSIAAIDAEIKRLRDEWYELNQESRELEDKKHEVYQEAKSKINALEEKLAKIKVDYASVFKQLYSSARGIIKRKRKFPSLELRDKIVVGHLALARGLAAKYYIMCDKTVEFDDLHQTAYEALMSAAHYYIPSSRAKFKTYATRCIENKLKRAIGETKKKQKRRPTKPIEFIDEELRRTDYVMMLIDACRNVRGKDGNKYFTNHFDLKPVGVQYNLKKDLLSYNKEQRELGLTREQLPGFRVKKSEVGFQEVLRIALSFMKESKMKVLISSEDLELASLVVANENHAYDVHEIYELLYIIELYQKKLKDVRLLLEVELELASSSDGITPSMEDMLNEVNRHIAAENKGIYKAKHSSKRVSYESLHSYYEIYYDLWGIDFLAQGEYANNRAKEIKDLEDDFEYKQKDALLCYRCLIEDISTSSEEEVCLYRHSDDDDGDYPFLETWDDDSWESQEERVFSKEDAIAFVKGLIEELENFTKKSYVDKVLKGRKQETLDELNRLNADVIEKNRAKESTIRQQRATRYMRYWTLENVWAASGWLSALYESGIAFSYLDPSNSVKPIQSVEDTAIGNIFMKDYLSALDSLPPLQRDVMSLYYDENGTHGTNAREIAEKLGIPEKTVYSEKDKALRLLRKNKVLKGYLE